MAGVWSCSLAKGHAGDHAFHAGHDLDTAAVFTWARTPATPNAATPAAPEEAVAHRSGDYDEYDLIPDATAHELRTLPTFAEVSLRARKRVASPVDQG